jgi:hypothetical protein
MSKKIREEFEAFASSHNSLKQFGFDRYPAEGDEYDAIPLQSAWEAWQASRADLVVELPEAFENDADGHWLVRRAEVKKIIEALGLKVTP